VLATVSVSAHTRHLDVGGAVVMPGFVDCHTHTVFAEYRLDEYEWRVAGTPYAEVAARGGGIAKSVARAPDAGGEPPAAAAAASDPSRDHNDRNKKRLRA
jgi:imidazolonepropionase-like amidohydrolase